MDAFAFHPYPEYARIGPNFAHPKTKSIGMADYNKLVQTLTKAFKGTAQPGSTLPIIYDEFGTQSVIPAAKAPHYTNLRNPVARDAVSEATQAAYYKQALAMAYCQPNVMGLLFFHIEDERNAIAWQSGLFYADGTEKSSLDPVRTAIFKVRDGDLTSCASSAGPLALKTVVFPEEKKYPLAHKEWLIKLTCVTKYSYVARLEKYPLGVPVARAEGDVEPNTPTDVVIRLSQEGLQLEQDYRIVVRSWKWGRIGTTVIKNGPLFSAEPPPPPAPPPPPPPPAPPVTPPVPGG
jgi:hypothetical protein